MKINVIFAGTDFENATALFERMNGLLAPFFESVPVSHLRCLYMGPAHHDGPECNDRAFHTLCQWMADLPAKHLALDRAATGKYILSGEYCGGLCDYMRQYPADVSIFAPTSAGKYLGSMAAAMAGDLCYTEVRSVDAVFPELKVRRKVYSAHGDGVFRGIYGRTVLIGSAAGESCPAGRIRGITAEESGSSGRVRGITAKESGLAGRTGGISDICMNEVTSLWQKPAGALPSFCRQLWETPKPDAGALIGAEVVFIGGKGLKTKANFLRLEALAQKFGAACGCTRPVASGGWTDYSKVVGISGGSLKARLCITFGVSGAAPFLYGVENVRHLVAVNKDERAPVFTRADEGIVEDCIKIIDALEGYPWPI